MLTDREKEVIELMGHPLYTVEFVESWLSQKTIPVRVNAVAALQQMAVEGFYQAVKYMARLPMPEKKCRFPEGIVIKPDGVNELDPCVYREVQAFANVTVRVMRCEKCGHEEVSWYRQEDTEEIEAE